MEPSGMKFTRRQILDLTAGAFLLPGSLPAWAQTYPARTVLLSVGFAAGGGTDLVGRLLAEWLSRRLGQQFLVENTTGMGGNLSIEKVSRSPADGYTLLFATPATTIGASLYRKLPFNFRRDFVPVAMVMRFPNVMVISPSLPVQSVKEFIDYAKASPGKLSYASSGAGTSLHLSAAMFCQAANVEMTHVPYRGSHAAYPDLIAGRVHVMFDNITIAMTMARSGKVRALGVTSATRWEPTPELPAIAETVPGYEAMVWYGIVAPKGTPSDVVLTLNKAVTEALNDPQFVARLAETGGLPVSMTPQQFDKFIDEDIERWRKVVDFAKAWID
jgi:tripartite-type tricarboxylate transporter receptor subunit TctC